MKVINKIVNGVLYIGVIGALFIGFFFFVSMVFSADSSLSTRTVFGILMVLSLISGYVHKETEVAKHPEN
jgi:fluoride ion exporter CrcB/FEX